MCSRKPGTPGTRICPKARNPESMLENSEGCWFWGEGWMARRNEGEYPLWVFDRGATKPAGLIRENPPGGSSFVEGRCWLGHHPARAGRGCFDCQSGADLAALATAKIPRRSAPRSFQTGSQGFRNPSFYFVSNSGRERFVLAASASKYVRDFSKMSFCLFMDKSYCSLFLVYSCWLFIISNTCFL